MLNPILSILAQATQPANAVRLAEVIKMPTQWPAQSDLLQWCQHTNAATAAILALSGAIYLVFGWQLHKALVTINATLAGSLLGAMIGDQAGNPVAGAIVGGVTAAAVAFLTLKWAVAVMGAAFGALVGISIWLSAGLEPRFAWAGGLSALIFFCMLSFIVFRGSVMTYTSLQGSAMLIFGLLGLVYKYQSIAPQITSGLTSKPFLLPLAIFIPTLAGLIYQQTSAEPAPGGPPVKK